MNLTDEQKRELRMELDALSEFERKVFTRFAKGFRPEYHQPAIQLEGDKQLPYCAAGHRLMKKGILVKWAACKWNLTKTGERMAVLWQQEQQAFVRVMEGEKCVGACGNTECTNCGGYL